MTNKKKRKRIYEKSICNGDLSNSYVKLSCPFVSNKAGNGREVKFVPLQTHGKLKQSKEHFVIVMFS